jgi:hypothetical protein
MRLDARDKLPWPVPQGIGFNFGEMLAHAGHELTVRVYRASNVPMETALVCKTCGRELRTASNPVANHAIQMRAIALYLDEFGRNKAMPFIVECETWASRRSEIETEVHGRIPKERILSIMMEDGTNPALFEAFWAQLQTAD